MLEQPSNLSRIRDMSCDCLTSFLIAIVFHCARKRYKACDTTCEVVTIYRAKELTPTYFIGLKGTVTRNF